MISKNVKYYCNDYTKIENYEEAVNDATEVWDCHHRLEAVFTTEELKKAGWYLNRKPEELIFLKRKEHSRNPEIHIYFKRNRFNSLSEETKKKISESKKGKKHSEERRKINSEAHKGQIAWNKGKKGFKHSEETKQKMSESRKGHLVSEETKTKISNSKRGKHWFNNGVICVCCFECPDGFKPGILRGVKKNEKTC
jgi:hypothetical protein